MLRELLKLNANETKPLLWPDPAADQKMVILEIGEYVETYDITLIGKQKAVEEDTPYGVTIIAKNIGREINIEKLTSSRSISRLLSKEIKEETKKGFVSKANFEENSDSTNADETYNKEDITINASINGFGVSVIDNEPKELIYMSVHEISFNLTKKVNGTNEDTKVNYGISCNITHVQIDNMLDKSFPIIFCPRSIFTVNSKPETRDEDWSPFIQARIGFTEIYEKKITLKRFDYCQLQLAEMMAFVDSEILMELMKVVSNISRGLAAGPEITNNTIDYSSPEVAFKELDAAFPKEFIANEVENKIFIEFLHLAAIKLNLSLRLQKVADLTGYQAILEVIYTILASISNISDAPIPFNEIVMRNTYTSFNNLIESLRKNYTGQAINNFYYFLGYADIIGNPIGLVNRLGSGISEFFNEPRKGILKGPKEFAKGLNKGFTSLFTNVVGGSLNSASRVTGSLYTILKNVGGEKVDKDTLRKTNSSFAGTLNEIKGGAFDLVKGFSGVVTKPYEGAKQEGATGFFKGIKKGFLGVVTLPAAALLRMGTSLMQNVETAVVGKGGVSQQGRIRFPRYITSGNVVIEYNEGLSEANLIIKTIDSEKYSAANILLFEVLEMNKQTKLSMVILTEQRILLLAYDKKVIAKALCIDIKQAKITEKNRVYSLILKHREEKSITFESTNREAILRCAMYFPSEIKSF